MRLPGSLVPGDNTSISPLQALLLPGHLAAAGGRGLPRIHGIHLRGAAGRPLQADPATGEYRPHNQNYICTLVTSAQIVAISLETAIQNGGIAFVVLGLTFESPISDMANMPIIAFFFCSTGHNHD